MTEKQLMRFSRSCDGYPNRTSCWNWLRYKNAKGYGRFYIGKTQYRAHRISYEHFKGPIPAGFTIDHLCRNHSCINPDHLEAVTLTENIMRGTSFSVVNARKTHCPYGHEYIPTFCATRQRMRRVCQTCQRAKGRKKKYKNLAGEQEQP